MNRMSVLRPRDLRVVATPEALTFAAVEELRRHAERAVAERGRFLLALSGGSTPLPLYQRLGRCAVALPWERTHLFWGDERDVPAEHEASNYGTVRREMLDHLAVRPAGIHPIVATGDDADATARTYETELNAFFDLAPGQLPRFDLVLLGLGGDGHTASLFPHDPVLSERRRLVAAPWVERFAAHRITVTVPVLNASRAALFLVDGAAKAEIVARVLEGPHDPLALPAQLIRPHDGELTWLLDRAAAARLRPDVS